MADTFNLSVLTPKAEIFSGMVTTVSVSGEQGEFGVLPGHYAYITSVKPGVLVIEDSKETRMYAVGDGFAQVAADKVSIVISSCLPAADVDVGAEQTRLDAAMKVLVEQEMGAPGTAEALIDQATALSRLAAAERFGASH